MSITKEAQAEALRRRIARNEEALPVLEILHPYRESSDTAQEVSATLIRGDNLPKLRSMAAFAPQSIDFCYIDPPYNTGSQFLYQDKRKPSGSTTQVVNDLFGQHQVWMDFMLPRLEAARELLTDEGVIAVSIDDHEQAYLKILMDRVFGEENCIGQIVVCRSKNGRGSSKNIASNHEYLLIYGKTEMAGLRGEEDKGIYNKSDAHGQFRVDGLFRKKGDASFREDRPNLYYPLYCNRSTGEVSVSPVEGFEEVYPLDSKGFARRWIWSKETAQERSHKLYASKGGVVYVKTYAHAGERTKIRSLWTDPSFYTERATNEIKSIFGEKIFDTPKPLDYIKKIIDICCKDDGLVLDFFAGSGTTAHALADLNNENGASRRCVLLESDAPIPDKHVAKEYGFNKVCDITESRLNILSKQFAGFSYRIM